MAAVEMETLILFMGNGDGQQRAGKPVQMEDQKFLNRIRELAPKEQLLQLFDFLH